MIGTCAGAGTPVAYFDCRVTPERSIEKRPIFRCNEYSLQGYRLMQAKVIQTIKSASRNFQKRHPFFAAVLLLGMVRQARDGNRLGKGTYHETEQTVVRTHIGRDYRSRPCRAAGLGRTLPPAFKRGENCQPKHKHREHRQPSNRHTGRAQPVKRFVHFPQPSKCFFHFPNAARIERQFFAQFGLRRFKQEFPWQHRLRRCAAFIGRSHRPAHTGRELPQRSLQFPLRFP